MNTTQLTCRILTATAIAMAILLVPALFTWVEAPAHGQMVVTKDNLTQITVRATTDSEVVCTLDSGQETLIAHVADRGGKTIRPLAVLNVDEEIAKRIRGGRDKDDDQKKGQGR